MWGQNEQAQGGGFVGGSQGGGDGQFGSPSAGGGDKASKGRRSNNVVPVTVKQLLDCQDENVLIVDTEAAVVTIVGLIVSVEQTTVKISIQIDDQTGVIDCINYTGADAVEAAAEIPFLPTVGNYGRIVGALRSMKGSKYIIIFKFLPIGDLNELTAHLLEVVQLPMKLKKLKETEALKTGVGMMGGLSNSLMANSMMVGTFSGLGGIPGMMGGSGAIGEASSASKSPFNSVQKMVLNIIQNNTADSGIHKDDIMSNLGGNITPKELEKILDDLGAEGHVYSTVDDDHFKSTD
ncbi:replication protein A 32 kDa subunit-B [Folsomia candida]|uniref:replication protein A 32 kDa subunit-B n=1 Tax=Folsomia candida TaxID=158441 RepID=UPI000B8FE521|nr:replication protein A 32 kDa subunit-B [Folsomia candida]